MKRFLDACENRHDEIQRPSIGFSRIDRNAVGAVDRVIGAFAEFVGQEIFEMNRGLEDNPFIRIGDLDRFCIVIGRDLDDPGHDQAISGEGQKFDIADDQGERLFTPFLAILPNLLHGHVVFMDAVLNASRVERAAGMEISSRSVIEYEDVAVGKNDWIMRPPGPVEVVSGDITVITQYEIK
jgi:hypothetical protein